ncbi:hypothetical protein Droror1_Dr00018343, partial [Drosera rotundifolia]
MSPILISPKSAAHSQILSSLIPLAQPPRSSQSPPPSYLRRFPLNLTPSDSLSSLSHA